MKIKLGKVVKRSQDISVSIVTRLWAGWSGKDSFSLHYHVQTRSGAHPAFYPMDTGVSFPRVKVAGAWNWLLTSI